MAKCKIAKNSKSIPVRRSRKGDDTRKAVASKLRANSKQAEVIGMLNRSQGATIPAIVKTTGWQQHSVRGFFAGVVRKKLGLTLESEKGEPDRIYRIAAAKPNVKANAERGVA